MKIYAFHLLNDFSGSPKVLMQVLKGCVENGLDTTVVSCTGREGFLSDLPGVKYKNYWYRWAANPYLRLLSLMLSQFLMICKLLAIVRREDLIYINTVLPFGAAFLGKVKGCRIIYHLHETTMKPPLLKRFLFGIAYWAADELIYVSRFLAEQEQAANQKVNILYNAIEDSFLQKAISDRKVKKPKGHVLMVCSLKPYKGVREFVALSQRHKDYQFRLVVNASQGQIDLFFRQDFLPDNLQIYPTQTNLHPFYAWADVILNLSRPDGWIETFGLTIIEGMAYGLPAIVPPVGGIIELVEEGQNGYSVDSRDTILLSNTLKKLLDNESQYLAMSECARKRIGAYRESVFQRKSQQIIQELH